MENKQFHIQLFEPKQDIVQAAKVCAASNKWKVICILQQCNCITTHAKGLSKHLFTHFPWSNCYLPSADILRIPGCTQICRPPEDAKQGIPYILNLFGQRYPGKPNRFETAAKRKEWFLQGLQHLTSHLKKLSLNCDSTLILCPVGIGCGLAGGDWTEYETVLQKWAATQSCVIYFVEKGNKE